MKGHRRISAELSILKRLGMTASEMPMRSIAMSAAGL
jgi:hypothetical protein